MKFIDLLNEEALWRIKKDNEFYDPDHIKNWVFHALQDWKDQFLNLSPDRYFIAVGYEPLDYFLFTLIASSLGLKMILCDPKMLDVLFENYHLDFQAIISTRKIKNIKIPSYVVSKEYRKRKISNIASVKHSANLIFFTSGTTSIPKLVVYDESALFLNAKKVGEYLDIKSLDATLCLFPTNYMYGFSTLMSTLIANGEIVLYRSTITPQEIWELIVHKKVKFVPLIRSLIEQLSKISIKYPHLYFDDLVILNASDRIYIEQVEGLLQYCPVFWNNFGQTESGPRIFAHRITLHDLEKLESFCYQGVIAPGKPIDERICIEVLDDRGVKQKAGKIGVLHYSSPYAMLGYLGCDGNLEKKKKIPSGDLVYQDEAGITYWVGRKNEIIKINGKFINISLLHKKFDQIESVERSYFTFDSKKEGLTGFFVPKFKQTSYQELEVFLFRYYRLCFPAYPRMDKIYFVETIPTTLTDKVHLRQLQNHMMSMEAA